MKIQRFKGKIIQKNDKFYLYRQNDKGENELFFKNINVIISILDQECEYEKVGKQIKVFYQGKLIYDSTKKENDPVFESDNNTKIIAKPTLASLINNHQTLASNLTDIDFISKNFADSFSLSDTCVPKDTREITTLKPEKIDNFSLKLNKFARFSIDEKGEKRFYFCNYKDKKDQNKNVILPTFEIKANFGNVQFSDINTRQTHLAKSLLGEENFISIEMRPDMRFVIGLGLDSVYETSMTLHHIYGFPYIPASTIKGALRSYIIQSEFHNNEVEALACPEFCDIFGCPADIEGKKSFYTEAREGLVTFFDAMPTERPTIKTDVMTPHYGEYYGDKTNRIAPADTQSPVPVPFLTVENTSFGFLLGSKKLTNIKSTEYWTKTIATWLKEALTTHGIGAKTAVGYGYFH